MAHETIAGAKYLLLEVPAYAQDAAGRPLTSYLRLGSVAHAEHVEDRQLMKGRTPEQGATEHARGAGQDLASIINGFRHDERDLCDPPELDDAMHQAGRAIFDQTSASAADLEILERQLEAQEKYTTALTEAIEAVVADPPGWLANLVKLLKQERETVAQLRAEQALAAPDTAQPGIAQPGTAAPGERIPPAYCVPGYSAEQPDAGAAYRSKAERRAESAQLHTRGGWRDHTDGNRISTTRGDKVEVVRGNYRMIVMGRHDYPCDADGNLILPGWDISGGHVEETTSTAVVPQSAVAWRKRWNGNWYATEQSIKGDTRSIHSGDSDDLVHGHWRINVTGSESPDKWHPPEECPGGRCRTNPKILDETWAEEVVSALGSHDCPIPIIEDVTHADLMESETRAGTIDDTRTAGKMTTFTSCGTMSDETTCGVMITHTTVETMSDETRCDMMTTLNMSGVRSSITIGNTVSTNIGMTNDLFLGNRLNVNVAASLDLSASIGASLTVGSKNSLTAGVVMEASFPDAKQVGTAVRSENNLGTISKFALLHRTSGLHVEIG